MQTAAAWMERHQVALCIAAIALGALTGLLAPAAAAPLEVATEPLIALLVYATFLGVPFRRMAVAARDLRFVTTLLAVNFLVVPLVVVALSRLVAHDRAVLVGVLLVLLAPCVDYVMAFTRMASGAHERLLAASPLLMLGQLAIIPLLIRAIAGPEVAEGIEPEPFLRAFVVMIVLPLAGAVVTQALRGWRAARILHETTTVLMVPLMMAVLGVVVATQIGAVVAHAAEVALAALVFALFAVVMTAVGMVVARVARLDAAGGRAVLFSGVTRNSLVVLPLALALPSALSLAPVVVVTQTLVELVAMVTLVRIVPRLVPAPTPQPE